MSDLIKALQIFLKYADPKYPTNCNHDVLVVCGIGKNDLSEEDRASLDALSFQWSDEYGGWLSFRFGSC
jgi:hypothetical protein